MSGSTISVIVRSGGRPVLLRRALASIEAQTVRPAKVVIVAIGEAGREAIPPDVSSTLSIPVVVVDAPEESRRGRTLNLGLAATTGTWLAILDDDDTWEPSFLEHMLAVGERECGDADFGGCVCRTEAVYEQVDADGTVQRLDAEPFNPTLTQLDGRTLWRGNAFTIHAALWRRSAVMALDGYDETLHVLEDWEFNFRAVHRYRLVVVTETLANYHQRPPQDLAPNTQATEHARQARALRRSWVNAGLLGEQVTRLESWQLEGADWIARRRSAVGARRRWERLARARELEPVKRAGSTWAVVVLYRPDETLVENVAALVAQCAGVVLVDNGSDAALVERCRDQGDVTVLDMGGNVGVATALNRGMAWAAEQGAAWVVTMDQDSRPEPGMVAALRESADGAVGMALVAPRILESALGGDYRWLKPGWGFRFRRMRCEGTDLSDVSMAITSGALTSVEAWRRLGGFDEALFVDFVDTDFCLRARRAGWRLRVCAAAKLRHHLGQRERRSLAGVVMHPTHHSAVRHYFVARNRVRMVARHGWRTAHWLSFEIVFTGVWIVRTLAFESDRARKLLGMLLGTWDGLRGRFGACPPRRLKALT